MKGRSIACMALCALLCLVRRVFADFNFRDFEFTRGLAFVGDAGTSNCDPVHDNRYSERHEANDHDQAALYPVKSEDVATRKAEHVETDNPFSTGQIGRELAGFGHRDQYAPSPDGICPVRLRLTGSSPHQTSAVWYSQPVSLLDGFETGFAFQITDLSRYCLEVKDRDFGSYHHQTCAVDGGDGFALVFQNSEEEMTALGDNGGQLGYGGIPNSVALEFDSHYNPDLGDLLYDHIGIHSNGIQFNTANTSSELRPPVAYTLADGYIHRVVVRYYDELKTEMLDHFSASTNLLQFLLDNGEGRRIGTLAIFMDDAIESGVPTLASPINLSVTLALRQQLAYIGFTATTGLRWEKHDLLSWYFCEEIPCFSKNGDLLATFDYLDSSALYSGKHGDDAVVV